MPGLARLPADEAHARELLLDIRLVRGDLFLVLLISKPTETGVHGKRERRASGRGAGKEGRIASAQFAVARPRDVIDAPASSRASWVPSRGTLCGGGRTSCRSRPRALRRISGGAGKRREEKAEKVSMMGIITKRRAAP